MDELIKRLPEIITAAAQSHLGIFALLCVALSVLAYVFFSSASEKIKVGIFTLLFFGVLGFGVALFRVAPAPPIPVQSAISTPSLSEEAKMLLKEAALDPSGLVLFERYGESVDLHTNGNSLLTSKADHRALALWESALDELVRYGFLANSDERGEVFEITKKGYEVAERIQ